MRARRTLLQYVVPIVVGWALGCDNPASPKPSADLLPPLTGSIKVSAPTTGSDLDPNGYTATLDLLQSQSVPTNGSTTFSGVLLGVHAVQLSGVASNCSLNSSNPQTVTLTGSSATASFSVNCTATTGSLTVTTSTTGSNLDPDGYTVTVDGNQKAIGINNSVTFSGLSPGNHSVQLNGLAQNCTVSSNPRTASITAGSTTKTTFSVGCTATTGTLKVTTSTLGSVPTNNYTVTVDWNTASAQQIAPNNGSVSFSNLSATSHSVALSGFPANCTVTSANPQSVNVPAGGTATAPFTVSCTATATTGTLTVTTTTTGSNLDLDGYTFTVTGAGQTATRAIATNGTSTFSGIPTGSYQVQLTPSSVAANCSVTNANPQTVNVPAGGTATTNFAVTCTTGTITISNTTTGSNLDPDGYAVIVTASDGTQEPATMATNGSVTGELSTGSYQVQLTPSSVAANCTVTSANPQPVNVPAGGTVTVNFNVTCGASTP